MLVLLKRFEHVKHGVIPQQNNWRERGLLFGTYGEKKKEIVSLFWFERKITKRIIKHNEFSFTHFSKVFFSSSSKQAVSFGIPDLWFIMLLGEYRGKAIRSS